jgi:uncharacterized membrane protein YraQ (UPF0718 family)
VEKLAFGTGAKMALRLGRAFRVGSENGYYGTKQLKLREEWSIMNFKSEWKKLAIIAGVFLACFYLPVGVQRFDNAVIESLALVKWYAREHVLLCLVPAFFIAGAVGIFISQGAVIKHLGADANKLKAYTVAAVSGTILAVCSCTVLPLFSGIRKRGAGLGPAIAFLYSGPAINVLAIIMTARVLGMEMGVGRAVGAILFSVVIGLLMSLIFRNDEADDRDAELAVPNDEKPRELWQTALYFASMVGILVFANFAEPASGDGWWRLLYGVKWYVTGAFALLLGASLVLWFGVRLWKVAVVACALAGSRFFAGASPMVLVLAGVIGLSLILATTEGETGEWLGESWWYAKMILPLLLLGVLVAGFLLGRPGGDGMIPSEWISNSVGGNSFSSNLFASVAGAFMYFATLTEVPILQGLMAKGMGKGPALALLLAGPALSLPNMLVIRQVIGTKKTAVYVSLVVIMATISGMLFGAMAG